MAAPGHLLRAHRVAYGYLVGDIADGLTLDHLCRNRRCINPAHLEPVSAAENTRRGIRWQLAKTHCPQGHPYAGENLITYPDGSRRACRACVNAYHRRLRAEQKGPIDA